MEIPEPELKHGRTVKDEIKQIVHNTEWFTAAKLQVNLQMLGEGTGESKAVILVNGKQNDVHVACNLLLRRLKVKTKILTLKLCTGTI